MNEEKVNGIVVRSVDYGENDKILTIYTLEKGKISARIKGVKKNGAKLKFASELFCFAEFIIVAKGNMNVVINASYIDSFYNLRLNLKKYYLSSFILECTNKLIEDNEEDENSFKFTLDAIKNICYKDEEKKDFAKYLLLLIDSLGYGDFSIYCHGCGSEIENKVYFDFNNAEFSCGDCRTEGFREIKIETYNTLSKMIQCQYDGINEGDDGVYSVIRFLIYYMEYKTEDKMSTTEYLLPMIIEKTI